MSEKVLFFVFMMPFYILWFLLCLLITVIGLPLCIVGMSLINGMEALCIVCDVICRLRFQRGWNALTLRVIIALLVFLIVALTIISNLTVPALHIPTVMLTATLLILSGKSVYGFLKRIWCELFLEVVFSTVGKEYGNTSERRNKDCFARAYGMFTGLSQEAAKSKYRTLSKLHHPDNGGDPEMFRRIQEEYERYRRAG